LQRQSIIWRRPDTTAKRSRLPLRCCAAARMEVEETSDIEEGGLGKPSL